MLADSLQDELLSIPGIASAEFEGSEEHPLGVRVQLAIGADPNQVGQAVQRVLASHGMRSQMAHDEPESFLPAGSVVNLSDYENQAIEDTDVVAPEPTPEHTPAEADLEVMSGPPPAVELPAVEIDAVDTASPDADDAVEEEPTTAVTHDVDEPVVEPVAEVPPADVVADPASEAPTIPVAIGGVAVDEDGTRVQVTVKSTDGRIAARSVPATPHGLDDAAAQATVELAAPDTMPRVIAVVDGSIEGSPVVTVMLEGVAGRRYAGSALIQGSRAYAVARATWAALQA